MNEQWSDHALVLKRRRRWRAVTAQLPSVLIGIVGVWLLGSHDDWRAKVGFGLLIVGIVGSWLTERRLAREARRAHLSTSPLRDH